MDYLPFEVQYIFYQFFDVKELCLIYDEIKDKITIDKYFRYNFNDEDWEQISESRKTSNDILLLINHDMDGYETLSESFIRKFQDKADWYLISKYQKLGESFIEEFQDKVDWGCITVYQKLSESFIETFKDKIDWSMISYNQELSGSLQEKYRLQME